MSIFNFNQLQKQSQSIQENSNRKGFFLIEISLSIFILLSFSALACSWYINLINNQTRAINKTQALICACSLLEYIRAFNRIPKIKKFDKFNISWRIKNLDIKNFKYITIIVKDKETVLELSTGAYIYD